VAIVGFCVQLCGILFFEYNIGERGTKNPEIKLRDFEIVLRTNSISG